MGRPGLPVFLLALALPCGASPAASAAVLTPDLAARAAALAPGGEIPVLIRFSERVDPAAFRHGRAGAPGLIRALRATAAHAQASALALLRSRGRAERARTLWIDDAIAVRATPALLEDLARLPGVERIEVDEPVRFAGDVPSPADALTSSWNLATIGVPAVWSTYGYDGTGVVIGSMDTGVDTSHAAIGAKWRGGANSWFDAVNGQPAPYDDHGHGTHTIGTLVGGDGPGPFPTDIGVAYGARFIAAKVLDLDNSFSTASTVIAGAQWMLDPDGNPDTDDFPQIVSNSWYFSSQTYTGFHATVDAWRAAGIIPVFCIGNYGPGAGTTRPPGNYDNVIGVGATDAADAIASFSSRGPSPSGGAFPHDHRKPDLCAPGVAVLSSVPGGSYQSWNGTSMATPHVAGTIALLLQAHPGLDYGTVRGLLLSTAVDLGAAGYDDDYGYGRLDAFAAVTAGGVGVAAPARPPGVELSARPNPSSGAMSFQWAAPAAGPVALGVFDVQGRRVARAAADAGATSLRWDGCDDSGATAPPGLYFVRCSDGRTTRTARIVRTR